MLRLLGGALALLLVAAIGLLVAWRVPDRSVDALTARWAPPPSRFVPVAGLSLHLRDEGPRDDSLPIVLLHGTSSSLHTWDGWARALSTHRRVIRYDMPGFGLTGPAADGRYDIDAYVRTLTAVLDTLHVARCVLAGNSLGGHVAWAMAALHPERVARLVLVDAAGYPFHSTSVPIGFRIANTPGLARLLQDVLPRPLVASSVRNVYGDPSRVTPALVDRYFDMTTRAGNRRAVVERFRQSRPGELSERIPSLRVPTLILWGGRDRLIPRASADRFHREIAGSRLVVFPDLGHVPHEEDPARTVAVVREFIGEP